MRPGELCGLLAEPDRLAVFAAVVLGARSAAEVAAATGLSAREVAMAVRRLTDGGLVSEIVGEGLIADTGAFKQAVRDALSGAGATGGAGAEATGLAEAAPGQDPELELDPDPARAAVLRAFIRDGRLVQMPAAYRKRRVVLEHIVTSFEPGRSYPERVVDAVLRAWYADHATLRRYLVDEQLMAREAGRYWRIGGPVWEGDIT